MIYELTPIYDARQSFYAKALVQVFEGVEVLLSYTMPVAKYENGVLKLLEMWDYSPTTLRHVKEFAKQHNIFVNTKKDLLQYVWRNPFKVPSLWRDFF